jgi:hypothetical protein
MGGLAVGDLQERGPPLADVGASVVVAQLKQFLALLFGQDEGAAGHGWILWPRACMADGINCDKFTDFESQNPSGFSWLIGR